ncbi:MAG: hypothetical protein AAGA05_05085 [Pseudomonadota bacterium]
MRAQAICGLLVATLVIGGCSAWRDSRVNPSNWFGGSRSVPAQTDGTGELNPLIPTRGRFARQPVVFNGVLVNEVTDLRIEATNSGAIVYAEGLGAREGGYDARLTPINPENPVDENGVLAYRFELLYPEAATRAGTSATRKVPVARSLSVQDLEAVRVIRVTGATNARESRRR